jgi:NTE family protein
MKSNIVVPETQRALVLQGGGGLGAYEVGVLKVLFDKLIEGKGNGEKEGPLFDIIAGTSMGAMNAAVLVSNIVNRNKTWEEAVEELENFWTSDENGLSSNPDFSKWWRNDGNEQNKNYQNKVGASEEALRKYYSVKEYFAHGTPRVCTPAFIRKIDEKFGDQKDNLWLHHSNNPLEDTITRYSKDQNNKKMKIATSWDKKQPRLLVINVDVAEGKTVTFDSYHKEAEDPKNSLYEGDGITIDHIMASGTIPEFYDFRKLGERQFCDGGLLSNTPFRELLQAHQNYWLRVIDKDKQKIPDLEVYIVNVHPSKGETIPEDDHDGVKDRINDITFFDRNSHYDENIVDTATDYIEIIDKLKDLTSIRWQIKNICTRPDFVVDQLFKFFGNSATTK